MGSHVVRDLLTNGKQVHVLTRSADEAEVLPIGVGN